VDTEDLPLNVSREMLQATPVLARIRKALIGRVLGELKTRAKEAPGETPGDARGEAPGDATADATADAPGDASDYAKFWENFGAWLKEGVWEDSEYRTELAPLLRFHSSTQDGLTSLAGYVGRMQAGQEAIYYLTGDSVEALKSSPQLEGFRAKGFEVLLLPDPIDAFWPERLDTFEGKRLRSVTHSLDDLGKDADLPDISLLTSALKAALEDEVSDVRATARLTDSAVVLAASDKGPDLQMQRLMRRAGRGMMPSLPVLEVNPSHKLIVALAARLADKDAVADVARTLLELARVQEGDLPKDPSGFARRVTALLADSLAPPG
jgi:molecular chaperone HtpG